MGPVLGAIGIAFATIFLAELGDKTQLLVLSLASRLPVRTVVAGTTMAIVVIFGASVLVGDLVGAALPRRPVAALAALAFAAFALKTLLDGDDHDDNPQDDHDRNVDGDVDGAGSEAAKAVERATKRSSVLGVFGAFLLAEFGDKSMLATITLAGRYPGLGVWIGSVAAETALCTGAAFVGRGLAARISPRLLRLGAAAMFAVLAVAMAVQAIRG